MMYTDVAESLVFLAGLVFLFVCGMTGLIHIALEAYKSVYIRVRQAERQIRALEQKAAGDIPVFEESKVCD